MHFLLSMPGGMEWILILLGIFLIAIPIWAIVDVIRSDFKQPDNKLLWILLIVVLPLIGSVLYYYMRDNQKIARS
jgi:hypothetical protein